LGVNDAGASSAAAFIVLHSLARPVMLIVDSSIGRPTRMPKVVSVEQRGTDFL
jgi:hypothetical protein